MGDNVNYVRVGRGGAGNMIPKTEIKKREQELEANTSVPNEGRGGSAEETTPVPVPHPPPGEYQHMGRGGAGNWFTPSELAAHGTTEMVGRAAATSEPTSEVASSTPRVWRGRGGAGNFAGEQKGPIEGVEVEEEEAERARKLEQDVRASVEQTLEKPGKAHLLAGGDEDPEKDWRDAGL